MGSGGFSGFFIQGSQNCHDPRPATSLPSAGPPQAEAVCRRIPQRLSPHHPGCQAYCSFILLVGQGAGAGPRQHVSPALGALGPEIGLLPALRQA